MTDQPVAKMLDFLKQMEQALPPPKNCHHGLMATVEDQLTLQVNYDGLFWPIYFTDLDFKKPTAELVKEVADLIKEMQQTGPSTPQPGSNPTVDTFVPEGP